MNRSVFLNGNYLIDFSKEKQRQNTKVNGVNQWISRHCLSIYQPQDRLKTSETNVVDYVKNTSYILRGFNYRYVIKVHNFSIE